MPGPAATATYAAIERAKTRWNVVYQEALVNLAEAMQRPISEGGNMPVRSQFLRSTLQVNFGGGLPLKEANPGGQFTYDPAEVNARLRTATVRKNSKVTLAYSAEYAGFANYRHQFVGLAVQRWVEFVASAAMRVRASG